MRAGGASPAPTKETSLPSRGSTGKEETNMILKNIAKICKAHGTLRLWDDGPYQQWLGDIGAAYNMAGAPVLDENTAAYLLDLSEKDLEKIDVKHFSETPGDVDFSDVSQDERAVDLPGQRYSFGGKELLAVATSEGMTLIDPDYLTPLRDIREGLEWYERRKENGLLYLVAATGWVTRAVIMPLDVLKYKELPAKLEAVAFGLREAIEAAEERLELAADGVGPYQDEQLTVDPETGEVGG